MIERAQSPLYNLTVAAEAAKTVSSIREQMDAARMPQEYRAEILKVVRARTSAGDAATALAIVEAAEAEEMGPALMWIGNCYTRDQNVVGLRYLLNKSELSEIQAEGLVIDLIHGMDMRKDSHLFAKNQGTTQLLVAHKRFSRGARKHLEDQLEHAIKAANAEEE